MTRIDLAHVDARVFADHAFREKVERIEAPGVHLQGEQTAGLHEFDRAKLERARESREFGRTRAPCACEDRGHIGYVEFARVRERRRIEASILREGSEGARELRPAGGAGSTVPRCDVK